MLAVKGATIYTVTKGVIHNGNLIVADGKIRALGKDVAVPKGAEVIDGRGKVVMPGFIEAHSHLGVFNEATGEPGFDGNEWVNPVTPHLRAKDGIWPQDMGFADAREGGVSVACVLPGSANVVGGLAVVVKTAGDAVEDMVLADDCGMKVAFGENPKRVYGGQKKSPATRMATAALLRETLTKARTYMEKKARAAKDKKKKTQPPDTDLGLEALIPVLKREIPLRAHAHRADDILTAIRIAREFNLRVAIEHCTEGHLIVDKLRKAKIEAAVVGPSLTSRPKVELKEKSFKTAGILARAGIPVCISTDHSVIPLRYFVILAGFAVSEGMDEDAALAAITINPARLCGVDKRVGSLEPGKDADFSIWDRHPFDSRARLEAMFIDGKKVYPEKE